MDKETDSNEAEVSLKMSKAHQFVLVIKLLDLKLRVFVIFWVVYVQALNNRTVFAKNLLLDVRY